METKQIIIFSFLIAGALAFEEPQVFMSKVVPRQDVPGFWIGRKIQPTKLFHHKFDRSSRIVGGNETQIGQIPHQVGLLVAIQWFTGLCGGCLLTQSRVITAAHCLDSSSSAQAILGAHNIFSASEPTQVRMTVYEEGYLIHPKYDPVWLHNDLALLELPRTVEFTQHIRPIALPEYELVREQFTGEIATVSGWGRTSDWSSATSEVLRYTHNEVKDNQLCRDLYGDFVIDSTMCLISINSGICNGDSGGPCTVKRDNKEVLIGVVSFGLLAGCQLGYPTGFARITEFLDWIIENLDDQKAILK